MVPNIAQEWDVLISPGVGSSVTFEMAIASPKTKVILIDGNVPKPFGLPNNFEFIHKLLGVEDSHNTVSLRSIFMEYCTDNQWAMLQMDIEGAEWPVLEEATEEDLQKLQIIILELHNLQNLQSHEFRDLYTVVLNKLVASHFCSHFHVNNAGGFFFFRGKRFPRVVEVTMLNRSYFTPTQEKNETSSLDSVSDPAIFDWKFTF